MFQNTFLFCNIDLYAAIIILINDYMRKSAMFWNPASGVEDESAPRTTEI